MSRAADAAWQHLSEFQYHQRRGIGPATVVQDMQLVRDTADEVIRAVIADMRAEGASWSEVGDALGVTRQAAQQRYRTVTE